MRANKQVAQYLRKRFLFVLDHSARVEATNADSSFPIMHHGAKVCPSVRLLVLSIAKFPSLFLTGGREWDTATPTTHFCLRISVGRFVRLSTLQSGLT